MQYTATYVSFLKKTIVRLSEYLYSPVWNFVVHFHSRMFRKCWGLLRRVQWANRPPIWPNAFVVASHYSSFHLDANVEITLFSDAYRKADLQATVGTPLCCLYFVFLCSPDHSKMVQSMYEYSRGILSFYQFVFIGLYFWRIPLRFIPLQRR